MFWRSLRSVRSFKVTDFGLKIESQYATSYYMVGVLTYIPSRTVPSYCELLDKFSLSTEDTCL